VECSLFGKVQFRSCATPSIEDCADERPLHEAERTPSPESRPAERLLGQVADLRTYDLRTRQDGRGSHGMCEDFAHARAFPDAMIYSD
jgi:hypothetical protein